MEGGSIAPVVDRNEKVTSGGTSSVGTVTSKHPDWARPIDLKSRPVCMESSYVYMQFHEGLGA
jgi:hypothetical protein